MKMIIIFNTNKPYRILMILYLIKSETKWKGMSRNNIKLLTIHLFTRWQFQGQVSWIISVWLQGNAFNAYETCLEDIFHYV